MSIVVTGAAGFIGSHLCERLVEDGENVIGLDNFSTYYARPLKQANLHRVHQAPNFRFIEADLCKQDIRGALDESVAVFHLAGRPGVRSAEVHAHLSENVRATEALVQAMSDAGVRRLIFASSSSVYGDSLGPVDEDANVAPRSVYGKAKLEAEQICLAASLDTTVLRYFSVYGPRQRPDMAFARFIASTLDGETAPLFGDGRQVRDFTYVEDVVRATVLARLHGVPGRTYNVAGASPTTINVAIALISSILGRGVMLDSEPALDIEARRTHGDVTRAQAELGWAPRVSLKDGLRRQVEASMAVRHAAIERSLGGEDVALR